MNLRRFAFLTDENIHPDVLGFLRGEGCDVLDVKESGLIGSRYYCDHPILPLENTVAMVNLDMVGRLRSDPGTKLRLLAGGFVPSVAREPVSLLRESFGQAILVMSGQSRKMYQNLTPKPEGTIFSKRS